MQGAVITQCPHCEERFKVTPGQLKLANGKVRCGECLTVFDALACAEDRAEREALQEKALKERTLQQERVPTYPEVDRRRPQPAPEPPQQPLNLQPAQPAEPFISIPTEPPVPTPVPTPAAPVPVTLAPAPVAPQQPSTTPAAARHSGLTAERDDRVRHQVPLLDIKPEPVVMHIREAEMENPYNVTGWLLGTLAAIGLLLFQLLWFERQMLAGYPQIRPIYYLLCDYLDCSLQGPKAVEQIATRQLIIRPNPYFTGALSVSVVLENQSPFNQHFPLLRLRFNDTQGRHVAGRDFTPQEYLNTQRIDPRHMTPGQPFELSLELLSPATGTLGYQLDLLPYH